MKIDDSHKNFFLAVVLSFLTYVIFFGQFLTPSHYFWSSDGQTSDAQTKHVPARTYFYEKIVDEHSFPFWTEKIYSGFPIYADPENAFLNPINDAAILIFGPLDSYKVLHVLEYLAGSLSLYFLLKRRGIGLFGFAAANAIFYFNTFFINHQVHFNMIMSLYLLPVAFLLADLFIEKRKLTFIFLQSLVIANAVLWGHMQSAVLLGMGIFLYMTVFSFKKMRFTTFLFYLAAVVSLAIIETLPQLIPTFELLSQSSRGSGTDYLKGSLSPRMAIFSFVPYLFGGYGNFIGEEIRNGFGYGEIYTYFGISSMILSLLALLFLKKSREVVLAFVFIWVFLIFAFLDSNKIFPDNTPIVTLFRFWVRTAVLSSFGVALLAAMAIEKLDKISCSDIKKNILFVLSPLVYIFVLIRLEASRAAREIDPYVSFQYIQSYPYFPVLEKITLVLFGTVALFFIYRKLRIRFSDKVLIAAKAILVAVVFFDLAYFSKDALASRLQDISDFKTAPISDEFKNKRVILNSLAIVGMESLYYDNWSPFGSSQLKAKSFVNFYNNKLDFKLRGVSSSSDTLPVNYQKLKEGGIVAIKMYDKTVYLNNSDLDLIKNDMQGYYEKKEEGNIAMRINSPSDTVIGTYIKYDPNWKVKIDGRETDIIKNEIFFDFPLSSGEHLVEMKYFPGAFYTGLTISLILGIIVVALVYFFRKNIEGLLWDDKAKNNG